MIKCDMCGDRSTVRDIYDVRENLRITDVLHEVCGDCLQWINDTTEEIRKKYYDAGEQAIKEKVADMIEENKNPSAHNTGA